MKGGKPAGVRCVHLTPDRKCSIHETGEYPGVCARLTPTAEMCGATFEEATDYLERLERLTTPDS